MGVPDEGRTPLPDRLPGEPSRPGLADQEVADLLTVLDVTLQLGATAELPPLLEVIERSALAVLHCERASVLLHDPATDELLGRRGHGAALIRFPAGEGVAGSVFRSGMLANVVDARADPRFDREADLAPGFRPRNILACPLRGWDGTVVGVLEALNKQGGSFDAWDEVLASSFAAQAGVAVQRQLLLESFARTRQYEREMDIARQVQQGLLPRHSPRVRGFDVAGWNQPANETGGDVFDFKPIGQGRLALCVADASGHGIGPALVIAQFRALMRAALAQSGEPERVAEMVNALLSEDLPEDRFVTAVFGRLEPREHRLRYVSAGHGPMLHYQSATGRLFELPSQGCPIGVRPGVPFEPPWEVTFATGDLVVILTDGFTEWIDASGRMFGNERLERLIQRYHALPASDLIAALYRSVLDFAGGTPQLDDLTALVLKRVD